MKLNELLGIVAGSSVDEWHRLGVHTLYQWDYGTENGQGFLRPSVHQNFAVYMPDVDISLAHGAMVREDFKEPWVECFSDPHASSCAIWLCYRGAVVNEWHGVHVDGGRYLVPMPERKNGSFEIAKADLPRARLLFELAGAGGVHTTVDEVLDRAKIRIV